jgi:hypothetical protein
MDEAHDETADEQAPAQRPRIDPRRIPPVTLLDGPFIGLRQHSVTAGPDGTFEVFGRSEKDPGVVEYHEYKRVGDANEARWVKLLRTQPVGGAKAE